MPSSDRSRLIVPGCCVGEFQLGKTFHQKNKVDGNKPRVLHDLREKSLIYEASGIDLCISVLTNELTSMSLFLGGGGRHEQFLGATNAGIGPGAREEDITQHLGQPDKIGDSFAMPGNRKSRRWISYDQGIAFEFNAAGLADLITVFPARG